MESVPGPGPAQAPAGDPGATPPVPGELGRGCAFTPRCPMASEICRAGDVELVEVAPGHHARCVKTHEVTRARMVAVAAAIANADRAAHDI